MSKKWMACALALFLALPFVGCQKKEEDIVVCMPDGAPALAFAKMMKEDTKEDGVCYQVVVPNLIRTKVTYEAEDKNADLCVLPLTVATKFLGNGNGYQMLGEVTHGNLYIIAKDAQLSYTKENLHTLVGKRVGVLQLGEVPGLVFKTVLHKAGIPYADDGGRYASKVNLVAITGAQDVGVLDVDCFVMAEPAVSAQRGKGFSIVGDVQALYGDECGYPQAVLVAKKTLIEEKKDWLTAFVNQVDASAKAVAQMDGETLTKTVSEHLEDRTYTTSLKANLLDMTGVLSRCGIGFLQSLNCKERVTAFLQSAQVVHSAMAVLPSEAFYYTFDFGV